MTDVTSSAWREIEALDACENSEWDLAAARHCGGSHGCIAPAIEELEQRGEATRFCYFPTCFKALEVEPLDRVDSTPSDLPTCRMPEIEALDRNRERPPVAFCMMCRSAPEIEALDAREAGARQCWPNCHASAPEIEVLDAREAGATRVCACQGCYRACHGPAVEDLDGGA